MKRSLSAILCLALLLGIFNWVPAYAVGLEPVKGAWLSPDWIFPGPRSYSEEDVRRIAHDTLAKAKEQGINTIFLETLLRGTSICPTLAVTNGQISLPDAHALNYGNYPVYHPLAFDFRIENNVPVDTLQIFIDEGARLGIRIHAWCHMFYWRMDNSDVVPSWKEGRSAWDDLLLGWLRETRDQFAQKGDPLAQVLDDTMKMVQAGYDGTAFEKILDQAKIPHQHNPLGSLIRTVMAAGGSQPPFLLITSPENPFPQPKHKVLRAVWVDPADPQVQNRIIAMVSNIVQTHPGLAGVQLDHVRYPTGPVGTPPELGLLNLGVNDNDYFDENNPILNDRYQKTVAMLNQRRQTLQDFVNRLRRYIGGRVQLSAAILPEYHRNRNQGRYRISYWEFISQDWYHWDVDFVVPLMYETAAWKIRTCMMRYREDLTALYGDQIPIQIYPGVSRIQQAESGLLEQEDWVYFDLKLADDVKVVREQQVDPLENGNEEPANSAEQSLHPVPTPTTDGPPPELPQPTPSPGGIPPLNP